MIAIQIQSRNTLTQVPSVSLQGFTTKNNNEIYEGDILQEVNSGKSVIVVYEAPQFCYSDNEYGYKFLNLPENFVIVGNIHD